MNPAAKVLDFIVTAAKNVSLVTLVFLMFFITYDVFSRKLGYPIVGDLEIVQFGMIVLIMFALAYTETLDAHISIGVIVDKFPMRVQLVFKVITGLLTIAACAVISWALVNKIAETTLTSDLLAIPFIWFKYLIVLGYVLWGLVAIMKTARNFGEILAHEHDKVV